MPGSGRVPFSASARPIWARRNSSRGESGCSASRPLVGIESQLELPLACVHTSEPVPAPGVREQLDAAPVVIDRGLVAAILLAQASRLQVERHGLASDPAQAPLYLGRAFGSGIARDSQPLVDDQPLCDQRETRHGPDQRARPATRASARGVRLGCREGRSSTRAIAAVAQLPDRAVEDEVVDVDHRERGHREARVPRQRAEQVGGE